MKSIKKTSLLLGFLSLIVLFGFAKQEKVLQIFRNGEIVQEYAVDDIDYIEINDLIQAPTEVNASVANDQITIRWNAVEGATYNVYRSPDNVNFTLLASKLTETSYTDTKPLSGTNFYRVKAVVGDVESGYTTSAAATLAKPELENGIYLGITGFNQTTYDYPVLQLAESSVDGFYNFIDGLTMKNGTLLYYSVDQALNAMQTTELPADISSAAIVTFTDGLDQGSMMKDVPYDDDMEYLDALHNRIKNETVSGQPITAFSIGIRGKDVADIDMFRTNLEKLASSPANATEVSSMSEVNEKFKEIAEKLSESNYVQTINLKMPGVSNGTLVRFTFDNVNSAENSQLYIEGKFNLKERSLEEVRYVGLTSTSGTTIKGKVEDIFVNFTFEGVHTDNNVLIKSEFTDEWTFITSNSSWQINSEFDKTENSDIVTERSSAVVMLVLDCSSSLADDFVRAQTNAKDFISTLYQAVGGTENNGEEETIYSTTPKDLTLSVWKDGTRYYLTPEQFKTANLNGAIIEGLMVIFGGEQFIIALHDIHDAAHSRIGIDWSKKLYGDLFPTETQGKIISMRWSDINTALESFRGDRITNPTYTAATYYDYNYYYNCLTGTGGSLTYTSKLPYIRPCKSDFDGHPIIWEEPDNLKLSVIIGGERVFLNYHEYNDRKDEIETVEGVLLIADGEKFIVKMEDEQNDPISDVDTAKLFYGHLMPTYKQGQIITVFWGYLNNALESFGGKRFSRYTYTTDTILTTYDYYTNVIDGDRGSLREVKKNDYTTYVRGVITLETYEQAD